MSEPSTSSWATRERPSAPRDHVSTVGMAMGEAPEAGLATRAGPWLVRSAPGTLGSPAAAGDVPPEPRLPWERDLERERGREKERTRPGALDPSLALAMARGGEGRLSGTRPLTLALPTLLALGDRLSAAAPVVVVAAAAAPLTTTTRRLDPERLGLGAGAAVLEEDAAAAAVAAAATAVVGVATRGVVAPSPSPSPSPSSPCASKGVGAAGLPPPPPPPPNPPRVSPSVREGGPRSTRSLSESLLMMALTSPKPPAGLSNGDSSVEAPERPSVLRIGVAR